MLAAVLAGLVVRQAASFVPIIISRATSAMFLLLMFNFLMGTRWSFHVFHRIGRFLARPARRLGVIGADARGAATVQHLHSTHRASAELLGLLDDDVFKHGKLFHGYRVLGLLDDLATIMARTPFDEIVSRRKRCLPRNWRRSSRSPVSHRIALRRFGSAAPT